MKTFLIFYSYQLTEIVQKIKEKLLKNLRTILKCIRKVCIYMIYRQPHVRKKSMNI